MVPNELIPVQRGYFRIFKPKTSAREAIAAGVHIKSELCSLSVEFNSKLICS